MKCDCPGELSDEALTAALRSHPELRKRVASIVLAVEGDEGELKEADAAEERIVDEMRLLGREALRSWAETRVEVTEREGYVSRDITRRESFGDNG